MKITDLKDEYKKEFCREMAICGFREETDSAFSNALLFLGIDEPSNKNFSYTEGIGQELYTDVEEAMTSTMYCKLIYVAVFNPKNFDKFADQNKGYEFAISMLKDAKPIKSQKQFEKLLESIREA